jgi:predicted PurR-regulated permease PerM
MNGILGTVFLAAITIVLIYLTWRLTAPFPNAFTWAFALAVTAGPAHRWFPARVSNIVATLLTIAAIVFVIAIPGMLLARELLQ